MALPFEPACLPLLPGALPYQSAAQAIEASRRYAGALLAWPQLPQRSFRESSLVQSVLGFPGLVIDAARAHVYVDRGRAADEIDQLSLAYLEHTPAYAALSGDDAVGLAELLRQPDALRGARAVKGQLLGPISVAAQLTDEHERPLVYDDMLFDALAQHLRLRAAWQELRLSELSATTIICVDEPLIEAVGMPFFPHSWERVQAQLDEVLAGVSGCRALFAGGAVGWERLMQTSADMLIADVYAHGHALVAASGSLTAFLDRGGIVGLGLVPASDEGLASHGVEALLAVVAALLHDLAMAGVDPAQLLHRAVITTAGTLGHLSVPVAERALQLVADVSQRLRELHQLA